jgi:hypothetical protein
VGDKGNLPGNVRSLNITFSVFNIIKPVIQRGILPARFTCRSCRLTGKAVPAETGGRIIRPDRKRSKRADVITAPAVNYLMVVGTAAVICTSAVKNIPQKRSRADFIITRPVTTTS